ncbi:MAG: MerR family transcriptional regulator [Pseudomonadales bacterium]
MFPIGVAAKKSGVGIEAIRYYEREGVVPVAARASNGRRLYDDAAIARLRFVRRCRDLGFSIDQVKALQSLSLSEANNCGDASTIGLLHLEEVRGKVADLQMLEAALVELLANCAEGQAHCPMLLRLFDD